MYSWTLFLLPFQNSYQFPFWIQIFFSLLFGHLHPSLIPCLHYGCNYTLKSFNMDRNWTQSNDIWLLFSFFFFFGVLNQYHFHNLFCVDCYWVTITNGIFSFVFYWLQKTWKEFFTLNFGSWVILTLSFFWYFATWMNLIRFLIWVSHLYYYRMYTLKVSKAVTNKARFTFGSRPISK